jgi:hypothetical protein
MIDRIHGSSNPEQIPQKRNKMARSVEKGTSKKDSLEISDQAKKLQEGKELVDISKSQFSGVSEIRQTKIEEIAGKIASKYYDDEDVISEIAGKLIHSKELMTALANQNQEAATGATKNPEKLAVIFNRIDRSFYNSIEVLDKIAGRILKDIQGNS